MTIKAIFALLFILVFINLITLGHFYSSVFVFIINAGKKNLKAK
jgi:hypothetical protein